MHQLRICISTRPLKLFILEEGENPLIRACAPHRLNGLFWQSTKLPVPTNQNNWVGTQTIFTLGWRSAGKEKNFFRNKVFLFFSQASNSFWSSFFFWRYKKKDFFMNKIWSQAVLADCIFEFSTRPQRVWGVWASLLSRFYGNSMQLRVRQKRWN
jgi:hypothetical protein